MRTDIIYRYDASRYIITDNGRPFANKFISLCEKFKFALTCWKKCCHSLNEAGMRN